MNEKDKPTQEVYALRNANSIYDLNIRILKSLQ